MALFQSGNPTLSQKMFDKSMTIQAENAGIMSVRGTMNKFGFLILMVLASAAFTWNLFQNDNRSTASILMLVGAFGGLILGLVISFKAKWSSFLSPAYAVLQGFFIGGISVVLNEAFADSYPNLILQAVGLTIAVAIAMFLLYNFRVIRPTEKFKSILLTATIGIAVFYGIRLLLSLFGINMPFMEFGNNSLLGIGISLIIVGIAALNLILDFERIEEGANMGAPKYMEWYCGFGLLVTIVWLYIEILRLLSRFASRD
jgi:uncharacterized YccA/Bax inhibitor family protein